MKQFFPWPLALLGALLLAGCAGPRAVRSGAPGGDAEFARLSRLARAAYDKGSLAQAETLFRQAHRRACERDAAALVGDSAYNLAAVLIARRRATEAWSLLDEAETELKRAGQVPLDVWLVKLRLAAAEGRTVEALRWAAAVEESGRATPSQLAHIALARGRLACNRRDAAEARRQLAQARQQATTDNPSLAAGIENLNGRLLLLEGRAAEAAAAFDREAELCRQAGQNVALAYALARAGDACAQAGDSRAGAQRLYRAARSLLAQQQVSAAQPLITRGEELARAAGDEPLQSRLRRLAAQAARARH